MSSFNCLVEGTLDEAIAKKILVHTGHTSLTCYGKQGCSYIINKIDGFNNAAKGSNFLVLLDFMDTKYECPPLAVKSILPNPNEKLLFRLVVRELESWLLADIRSLARYLRVSVSRIAMKPECLQDPKAELVNLARRSRNKRIRNAIVPKSGTTAQVGTLYNSVLQEYISNHWEPDVAREYSRSLHHCLAALERYSK